jgi:uncharacterized protein (DUF1499 family)/type IV secretory pathway VirB2 component (pilin)
VTAIVLAAGALSLMLLAPLGWRTGLLPLLASFGLLMLGGLLAVLGAVLAAAALVFGRLGLRWQQAVLPCLVVLLGIGVVFEAGEIKSEGAPPIHDITTDPENPPPFIAVLPARQAEHAASEVYAGDAVARAQRAAYPDILPVSLGLPPARAFDVALATARSMPGWRVVASNPAAGRIEASQASFWFGFVDDIVIRISANDQGSRVDIRSLSRQGKGDLGVNARRVRAYIAALRHAAG